MKKHKQRKLRNAILEHIKENSRDYVILLTLFILGIVIGVFFINHSSDSQKQEITSYINTYINTLKEKRQLDYIGLLKDSILKNIFLATLLWFIGIAATLIPIIYAIVAFRGFCLGYTISSAIAILGVGNGLIFSGSTLLLQNILIIPAMLAIAFSGIQLHKRILKSPKDNIRDEIRAKSRHGKENIKLEILRHSIFSLFMTGILVLASFIEVYVSANLFNLVVQYI